MGDGVIAWCHKEKNHENFKHWLGWERIGATIKATFICLILAAFRETRLRTVFVSKQDYSKQISGSNTNIYPQQKSPQDPLLPSFPLSSERRKDVVASLHHRCQLSRAQQERSSAGETPWGSRPFSKEKPESCLHITPPTEHQNLPQSLLSICKTTLKRWAEMSRREPVSWPRNSISPSHTCHCPYTLLCSRQDWPSRQAHL